MSFTIDSKLEKFRSLSTFEEEKDIVPSYEEEKNEKDYSFLPTNRKIIFALDDSDSEDSLLDLVLDDEEVTYLNNLFLKPNPILGLSVDEVEEKPSTL